MVYKALPGEDLADIAAKFNTFVEVLLEVLASNTLSTGLSEVQYLAIVFVPHPAKVCLHLCTHELQANHILNPQNVAPGQLLWIPLTYQIKWVRPDALAVNVTNPDLRFYSLRIDAVPVTSAGRHLMVFVSKVWCEN